VRELMTAWWLRSPLPRDWTGSVNRLILIHLTAPGAGSWATPEVRDRHGHAEGDTARYREERRTWGVVRKTAPFARSSW